MALRSWHWTAGWGSMAEAYLPKPALRFRARFWAVVLAAAGATVVAALVLTAGHFVPGSSAGVVPRPDAFLPLFGSSHISVGAAARAAASVVRVRAKDILRPWAQSHGSGFVWDAAGHIVTNFHVVRGATLLTVHFADDAACRARVIGGSPECDLAVLAVTKGCLAARQTWWRARVGPRPLELQRQRPRAGQRVAAVGHPGHWSLLVGEGVVSGVGRRTSRLLRELKASGNVDSFQRRCAADGLVLATSIGAGSGSSGGPLLSTSGRVVGVVTWQFGGAVDVIAAIDAEVLRRVVPFLIDAGEYLPPTVGLEVGLGAARLALPKHGGNNALLGAHPEGVRLWGRPGPEAHRAGLRRFDEVLSLSGVAVMHPADCLEAVQRATPGTQLAVTFRRPSDADNVERCAKITVGHTKKRKWRRRALRVFRAGARAYVAARLVTIVGTGAWGGRKDVASVVRGVRVLLENATTRVPGPNKLLKAAMHFALSPPENICGGFHFGRSCKTEPGLRSWTWRGIKDLDACRKHCEGQGTDGQESCCSFVEDKQTCQFMSTPNATDPFEAVQPQTPRVPMPSKNAEVKRSQSVPKVTTASSSIQRKMAKAKAVQAVALSEPAAALCFAFRPGQAKDKVMRLLNLVSGVLLD